MNIGIKEIRATNAPFFSVVDEDVLERSPFVICPTHIDLERNANFDGYFTNAETAAAARRIVRLCQQRNGWFSFTLDELSKFAGMDFDFHSLLDYLYSEAQSDELRVDQGLIVIGADKRFRVTAEFIFLCYRAAYVPDAPESPK